MFAENENGKFRLVSWEQNKWRKKLGNLRYAYLVLFIHHVNSVVKDAWKELKRLRELTSVQKDKIEDLEKHLTYALIFHNCTFHPSFGGGHVGYTFGDGTIWREWVPNEDTGSIFPTKEDFVGVAVERMIKRRPALMQTSEGWFYLISDDIPF